MDITIFEFFSNRLLEVLWLVNKGTLLILVFSLFYSLVRHFNYLYNKKFKDFRKNFKVNRKNYTLLRGYHKIKNVLKKSRIIPVKEMNRSSSIYLLVSGYRIRPVLFITSFNHKAQLVIQNFNQAVLIINYPRLRVIEDINFKTFIEMNQIIKSREELSVFSEGCLPSGFVLMDPVVIVDNKVKLSSSSPYTVLYPKMLSRLIKEEDNKVDLALSRYNLKLLNKILEK